MTSEVPRIEHWHAGDPLGLLHELLTRKALLARFAKFAYEVTEIHNAHPMRLLRHRMGLQLYTRRWD
jgi:hypothetical protein